MSNHYVITGKVTGDKYLVLLETHGSRLYMPNHWRYTPTWGLSYYPMAGRRFAKLPPWMTHLHVLWTIRRIERLEAKDRRRRQAIQRFAKSKETTNE